MRLFFFQQKTAYEMRISDWSSDVCSSDLMTGYRSVKQGFAKSYQQSREKIQANNNNPTEDLKDALENCPAEVTDIFRTGSLLSHAASRVGAADWAEVMRARVGDVYMRWDPNDKVPLFSAIPACPRQDTRSEEHTSELQSLMRNSYAVLGWEKKK